MITSASKFHKIIFLLAAAVYVLTAIRSHGFYHADEHYQIIEFAGIKLGSHSGEGDMAWEFQAQSRQAIQPTIAYLIFSALQAIGISDPYILASALRLISCIFALLVIRFFVKVNLDKILPQYRHLFIFSSYLLWFLPVVNIRFSSESWSGITFLLSLALLLKADQKGKERAFLIGCLLGLSFLFRYQTAFLSLGLAGWMIFIRKVSLRWFLSMSGGVLALIAAGILIDSWFYSNWVITAWEYFHKQIVEDVASGFGTSPWYFYITESVRAPMIPFGILILLSFLWIVIKKPHNVLVWCILPFLAIHFIIPHKEVRFLLPLANFLPLILILALQELPFRISLRSPYTLSVLALLAVLNTLGLTAMAFKSAGTGRMEITHYIRHNYGNDPLHLIYLSWANPYNPWHSVPMKFYQEEDMTETRISSLCELQDSLIPGKRTHLLIARGYDLEQESCREKMEALGFTRVHQSIPPWIANLNVYYDAFDKGEMLYLYEVQGKQLRNSGAP